MNQPTLYILMRTDMASMNPGKAMAQAAHAANAFVRDARDEHYHIADWESSTPQGFGTTLTLAVGSQEALEDAVEEAVADGFHADTIHDPTYPVRDGSVTHYVPVNTCGYVFTRCRITNPVPSLASLELHP